MPTSTVEDRLRASLEAAAERQSEIEAQMSLPDIASNRLQMQRLGANTRAFPHWFGCAMNSTR